MKELNIEIAVKIYDYEELDAADRELMDAAREATNRSYAPYSHFSVGAAARLANGIVVTGTNQENAAYPSGLCAERTTLFYANSQHPDQAVPPSPLLHATSTTSSWSLPSRPAAPAGK